MSGNSQLVHAARAHPGSGTATSLHEWVDGQLEPFPQDATTPPSAWSHASLSESHDAELEALLAQSPAERGTKQSPITWLSEPESFAPMAKLVAGQQFSIVTDHLGTPVLMTDARGETAWSTQHSVYGALRSLKGTRHACPFRWPGQYEDLATGLHYNRFRYYDAEAGQYAHQDPIGLAGGSALYAYVHDPMAWSDPLGLSGSCGLRRTKHVENRHIDRKKYPDKSKYRKPNQLDKLNARTMADPDLIVTQPNGRVRYEKAFDREMGTRGETVNRVVVDNARTSL